MHVKTLVLVQGFGRGINVAGKLPHMYIPIQLALMATSDGYVLYLVLF